jgi:hypothetical protein
MKTLLLAAAKVILTVGLFALAFRSIDVGDVAFHIKQLPLALLVVTVALLLFQMLVTSMRLSAIAGMITSRVPLLTSFRINWIGSFFSLALVTFVSGDVVRTLMLRRECQLPMRESVGTVTLDRAVGLLAILVIVSTTAPWAIQLTGDERIRHSIEVLAVIGALIVPHRRRRARQDQRLKNSLRLARRHDRGTPPFRRTPRTSEDPDHQPSGPDHQCDGYFLSDQRNGRGSFDLAVPADRADGDADLAAAVLGGRLGPA